MKRIRFTVRCILFLTFFVGTAFSQERPKIGLVLSGGGARGFAHIGVLKMLDSLQIPVDYVAGTSMGGIAGALYSVGMRGEAMEEMAFSQDWLDLFTDKPPRILQPYFQKQESPRYQVEFGLATLPPTLPTGLIVGQKLSLLFSRLTFAYEDVGSFDRLPIPFRCVAVDLYTGNEVVLGSGSLAKAMRSTMAIPTIFSAVEMGDSLLIDGGIINNMPVDVVKAMGADIVIAVDVMGPGGEQREIDTVLDVLQQSMGVVGMDRWRRNRAEADIYIRPDLEGYTIGDFLNERIEGIVRRGDEAAERARPELVALKNRYELVRSKIVEEHPPDGSPPRIYSLAFEGQESLRFSVLRNMLGVNPGDVLDLNVLNTHVLEMYGTGHFESIRYVLEPAEEGWVHLRILFEEKPYRLLRFGFRYDDFHQLVVAANIRTLNFPVQGLRFEHELQFAGLTRYQTKAYYPPGTLAIPFYPYARGGYRNVPTDIYDGRGEKIAQYEDRAFFGAVGLGWVQGRVFNLESEYFLENTDIEPNIAMQDSTLFPCWRDRLRGIRVRAAYDALDDLLLPRRGVLMEAVYEASLQKLRTVEPYTRLALSLDVYGTFLHRHTLRLYGYWGTGSETLPAYKYHNQGRPETFVGVSYDRLYGNRVLLFRTEYRWEFMPYFHLKMMGNVLLDYEFRMHGAVSRVGRLFGFGLGIVVYTPLGTAEVTMGWGDKDFVDGGDMAARVYVKLGTHF